MTMLPRPKKALGQNFLTDRNCIERIIAAGRLGESDPVLEIGPGRGALTEILASRPAGLIAIEFDRELAALHRQRYHDTPTVQIVEEDVLKSDFSTLLAKGAPYTVIANLPYNISTPVLFKFLEHRLLFRRLVVMLQKEVGERLAAPPDCSDYGVLTILFRQWFEVRREFLVKPGCFYPPPKVDSVVISLTPRPESLVVVEDQALFEQVVRGGFSMRRKTLWNCLRSTLSLSEHTLATACDQAGIDPKRRGETLTIEEYARLSTVLKQNQPAG
ncbi:MAG: 16S rRNA (adenine(1518)-N(6)/adenine(1519)-N(6))-dimethyltransferase RsmA [Trichlorobacter sp.]